ncbi:MAG: hypothetical protein ACTSRW_08555 [Candidatus Helarchaeota archaeon]
MVSSKTILVIPMVVGIILLIVGGIFGVVGYLLFMQAFGNPFLPIQQISQLASSGMSMMMVGSLLAVPGFVCIIAAVLFLIIGYRKKIAKTLAKESAEIAEEIAPMQVRIAKAQAPAVETIAKAQAKGFRKGFEDSDDLDSSSEDSTIRIRCRNCGYLETEDAQFCSKCGKEL